jgi:hypothetical protein
LCRKRRELDEFGKGTVFYPEERRATVPIRIHKRLFPFARFTRAMWLVSAEHKYDFLAA